MLVLRLLVTAFAALITTVDTVILGSYGTLVGAVPPRGDWTRKGARLWARIILWSALVRLRVEGAARVGGGPVVFMANHESWLDIPALLVAIPGQVRFLAKRSLFGIPFLGWAMRAMGFIPVDRENRRTAIKSFDEAAARIRAGRSVLVFPEETRTPDGSLLPFQRGGFLIALKAGLPIVPVGIEGARRVLAKGSYLVRPGRIVVRFGEPIPTAGLGVTAKGELMERVRGAILELRGGLAAQPVT
ncbi:MAG: 1-acyl-sn-glycerol-3-phosphate acyltransferase [Acidobacteriota bacterium]